MAESGTVKFFNHVEASGLNDGLDEGDRVTFDTDKDREGRPMAVRLSRVGR